MYCCGAAAQPARSTRRLWDRLAGKQGKGGWRGEGEGGREEEDEGGNGGAAAARRGGFGARRRMQGEAAHRRR